LVFILGISLSSEGPQGLGRFHGSPRHAQPGGPKERAFKRNIREKASGTRIRRARHGGGRAKPGFL